MANVDGRALVLGRNRLMCRVGTVRFRFCCCRANQSRSS
jgi:hypothetical protein